MLFVDIFGVPLLLERPTVLVGELVATAIRRARHVSRGRSAIETLSQFVAMSVANARSLGRQTLGARIDLARAVCDPIVGSAVIGMGVHGVEERTVGVPVGAASSEACFAVRLEPGGRLLEHDDQAGRARGGVELLVPEVRIGVAMLAAALVEPRAVGPRVAWALAELNTAVTVRVG